MELIVVILIVAMLSVTAIARFLDISDDANLATAEQIAAAFSQSASNVRIKWLLSGMPKGASTNEGPEVDIDGTLVRVDPASGYPVGDNGPDTANALTNRDCVRIFNDLL